MITITNVSPDDCYSNKDNPYELRINGNLICSFTHTREFRGLAVCLRDAADAVEAQQDADQLTLLGRVNKLINDSEIGKCTK